MEIKYLITDVDGVIIDRMPAILAAGAKAVAPLGVSEEQAISHLLATLGAPFEIQIKGMIAQNGKTPSDEEIRQTKIRFWEAYKDHEIKLFPRVKDTLDELKSRGIDILASTGSKTSEIEGIFKQFGLPCDFVLGSDKILKGDGHIIAFAGHLSLDKPVFCRQAAFVGDGTVDMEIAARNGIFGIGITNSIPAGLLLAAGARTIITDFKQVVKLLNK